MEIPTQPEGSDKAGLEKPDYTVKHTYGLVSAYRLQSMTVAFDEENPNNMMLQFKTRKRAEEILHATGVDAVMAKTDAAFAAKGKRGLEAAQDEELVQLVRVENGLQQKVFYARSEKELEMAVQEVAALHKHDVSSSVLQPEEKKEVTNLMKGAHLDTKYSTVPLHRPFEKNNVVASDAQENKLQNTQQEEKKVIHNIMKGAYIDPHFGMVSLISKKPDDTSVHDLKQKEVNPDPSKDAAPAIASQTEPHSETATASASTEPSTSTTLNPDKTWASYQPTPATRNESSPERMEKVEAYLKSRGKKALDGLKKYGLKAVVGTYKGVKKYGPGAVKGTLEMAALAPWQLRLGLGFSTALLAAATGGTTAFLSFATSSTFFASGLYKTLIKLNEEDKKKKGEPFTEKDKQRIALSALILGIASATASTALFDWIGDLVHGTHATSGSGLSTATGSGVGDVSSVSPGASIESVHSPDLTGTGGAPDIVESMRESQVAVEQSMRESAGSMDAAIREASGMYPQGDAVPVAASTPDTLATGVTQNVQPQAQPTGTNGQTIQQMMKESASKMDAIVRGSSGMYPS